MSLLVFLGIMAICCGYAFLYGGAPERIGAGLQVAAFALNLPVHFILEASAYRSTISWTAAIDVALLFALIVLAHRSTRFWPVWLGGWQAAEIVAHAAKALDPDMLATGYAIQAQIWAYPMLIATAIGTLRHQRRLSSGDPDWAWKSAYT